jgi:Fe(3+) dicitrate transport protein
MKLLGLVFLWTLSLTVLGQVSKKELSKKTDDTIYVIGTNENVFTQPGSAHVVDQEQLETLDHSDVSRVLDKVPGVYIQEEDGMGLRPNIGMRGAHPHRSKKVTLMEDGVLVAPAPYSSPAAYYFPNMAIIDGVEVYKGPGSVKYGPNSIGGAVNMITTPYGAAAGTRADVTLGPIEKLNMTHQEANLHIGLHRVQTDGFKELPVDKPTSMERNDVVFKYRWQNWQTKLHFGQEQSYETYLGLTSQDFDDNAQQRYAASQDDLMEWNRYAIEIRNQEDLSSNTRLTTTVYHQQMNRNWSKFAGIGTGASPREVMLNPDAFQIEYGLLSGTRNSQNPNEVILIGGNDRDLLSQGIQTKMNTFFQIGESYHDFSIGIRAHRDYVDRNHTWIDAQMINQELVYDENSLRDGTQNKDESRALSIFLEDEMTYGNWTILAGSRFEYVDSERRDRRDNSRNTDLQETAFAPGISANYRVSENLSVLAGVNKGIVIVGPGQTDDIGQEESFNYEAGARYRKGNTQLEAIGFFSDYQNIKGVCSFSSGCNPDDVDTQFNGGEAEIYGLETLARSEFQYAGWNFPVLFSYTWTVAQFNNSFAIDNPEWGTGNIQPGDPLPYVPQDTWNLQVQAVKGDWRNTLSFLWKGRMADQSVAQDRVIIPAYGVIDWGLDYRYSRKTMLFAGVNNLLNNSYLVGLRPFGARPGLPRTLRVGLRHQF